MTIYVNTAAPAAANTTITWNYVGQSGQPAFQNNWSNYGSYTTRFGKLNGVVYIEAELAPGNGDYEVAFTLPSGYRPSQSLDVANNAFSSSSNAFTNGYCIIGADGTVYVAIGNDDDTNTNYIGFTTSYPAEQ